MTRMSRWSSDWVVVALVGVQANQFFRAADIASFFMLTPLPGSCDHQAMVEAGAPMSSDQVDMVLTFIIDDPYTEHRHPRSRL
jgi:hypothetical protein